MSYFSVKALLRLNWQTSERSPDLSICICNWTFSSFIPHPCFHWQTFICTISLRWLSCLNLHDEVLLKAIASWLLHLSCSSLDNKCADLGLIQSSSKRQKKMLHLVCSSVSTWPWIDASVCCSHRIRTVYSLLFLNYWRLFLSSRCLLFFFNKSVALYTDNCLCLRPLKVYYNFNIHFEVWKN